MSHLRHTVLGIALATTALSSWAQTDAEHTQHQAQAAAAGKSQAQPSDLATKPDGSQNSAAMDSKMNAMREMHEKMLSAKTPQEKQALMAEHMKTMQDCMKMMSMMGGTGMAGMQGKKRMPGNMSQRQQMMEKRMEVMEAMMQMMMDQMPPPATR